MKTYYKNTYMPYKSRIIRSVHHSRYPNITQRIVGYYMSGTLAKNTKAMRGLSSFQMSIVQSLHDDPCKYYTVEEARNIATGTSLMSNRYQWESRTPINLTTMNPQIDAILENFGHPTQHIVKEYEDLANRVGYDLLQHKKLQTSTITNLSLLFEASKPLHFGFNTYLQTSWDDKVRSYSGSKTGIPLYSIIRNSLTNAFKGEFVTIDNLNSILWNVSGRAPEVHHLLYKKIYPQLSVVPNNLMLAERSASESREGPGQHELMHKVFSGNHSDKFRVLLNPVVLEYNNWLKTNGKLL